MPNLKDEVVDRMVSAAAHLLSLLDNEARLLMLLGDIDCEERKRWFYTPTDHGGLPLGAMSPRQQQAALELLSTGMSVAGYAAASTIMGLENVLALREGWRMGGVGGADSRFRDPLRYSVAIFGEPAMTGTWGWRFGGHHISLHYTVHNGEIISSTPSFLGAHPADSGPGIRPLTLEEELGYELVESLDGDQLAIATLSDVPPWDIVSGNESAAYDRDQPPRVWETMRETFTGDRLDWLRRAQSSAEELLGIEPAHLAAFALTKEPRGIVATSLRPKQRRTLEALLRQYLGRLPAPVADERWSRLSGPAFERMHFAWAGAVVPGKPHYYRVQGADLLIEFDNTQDGANHVHSVYRDRVTDFGDDVLGRHLAAWH